MSSNIRPQLNKVHHWGFPPSHTELLNTLVKREVRTLLVNKTFKKLGWELAYSDDRMACAVFKHTFGTEKIIVTVNPTGLEVKSKSDGTFWDAGKNSKRVAEFIEEFHHQENSITKEEDQKLREESNKLYQFSDYVIPDKLSPPPNLTKGDPFAFLVGCIFLAVISGFIYGWLRFELPKGMLLFAILLGYALGYGTGLLIRLTNFIQYDKIKKVNKLKIVVFFVSDQLIWAMLSGNDSFESYKKSSFEFYSNSIFDLLLLGGIQIFFITIPHFLLTLKLLFKFLTDRIPKDVVDFVYYHTLKNTEEGKLRSELSRMGWSEEEDQNAAMAALEAHYAATQHQKQMSQ